MFTGLVQHLGRLVGLTSTKTGAELAIGVDGWKHRAEPGESIAVNGCCLTVTDVKQHELRFDVIHQTLAVTALGDLQLGGGVNLEHAATPQTLLGGHIVQGHIDGIGIVRALVSDGAEHRIRVEPPPQLMDFIVEKGSIAVDGVSLTIASVQDHDFEVALIPTTLRLTNLGGLRAGARVNLETDHIAKITVNWLRRRNSTE